MTSANTDKQDQVSEAEALETQSTEAQAADTKAQGVKTANTAQAEGVDIKFEDEKGMYGTSPATSDIGEKELEHLTSQTMPRVILSRSYKKIFMYISVLMIMLFIPQVCYYRTSEITGLMPGSIYGLGEMGLVIICTLLSIANFFMIAPEDADRVLRHVVRVIGTGVPLLLLVALYTLPADLIHRMTWFLY